MFTNMSTWNQDFLKMLQFGEDHDALSLNQVKINLLWIINVLN